MARVAFRLDLGVFDNGASGEKPDPIGTPDRTPEHITKKKS